MRFPSRKSIIIILTIALIYSVLMVSPAAAAPTAPEKTLLGLVNDYRASLGLPRLRFGSKLITAARRHSQDMIANNYFSHTSSNGDNLADRLKNSGVTGWMSAGENLAGAPTPEIAFDLWVKSPAHNANILRRNYNRVGIGITEAGPYGMMITMDLAEKPVGARAEKLSRVKSKAGL